jgi:hypothetical protein
MHGVFNGVKGVWVFIDMLCEPGRAAVSLESMLVFVVPYYEIFLSVPHKLSYNWGISICILPMSRICQDAGSYV